MNRAPFLRPRTLLCLALLAPFLSACASTGGGASGSTRPNAAVRQPVKPPPRDAVVHMLPGLEGVIGADQKELVRQFGQPRLNVWEGDARKLQFGAAACVLDIYLYPTTQSREPLATYLEARRASDGQEVDRAACVTALRQK
ncbi:hypothetical protein [Novosphingobium album (ex Liu et al. 2023)]|uniref:Lipoprotein n=1 Tax=Novosphingobium album (ex Liu et al. 2023) TaxID=3031130 RepID=A0ABT5WNW9_9SPHN|nr:hypothetical protein [Novosphingobium album (ex Liu et al. 2023)]MDE8651721.1 hypothetical protein [Novosphingobium album (ex Liu et al. 2023)]